MDLHDLEEIDSFAWSHTAMHVCQLCPQNSLQRRGWDQQSESQMFCLWAICSWKWNIVPVWLLLWLVSIGVNWLETSERLKDLRKKKHGSSRVVCFFLYVKVVAVIHQPRYDTLQLFDDLILLAVGGSVVYAGPTEAVPTGKNLPVEWKSWEWHWEICEQYTVNQYSIWQHLTEPYICLRNLKLSDFWENNRRRKHCRAVLPIFHIFHSMSCPFVMDLIRPQNPQTLQSCQDAVEHFQTKLHAMLAGLWDGPFDGLAQEISPETFTFPSRFESRKSRTWSQKFQVKFSNNTNPADVL